MNVLTFIFFVFAITVVQCDNDVQKAFKDSEIVPDMIDVPPDTELSVKYLNSTLEIHLGNEVKPSQVADSPDINYEGSADAYFTFLMTDLDVPSRENHTLRELLHCVIGNIPGNDLQTAEVLADYLGPSPPQGAGLHRYVFLLFGQPGKITFDADDFANRPYFSTKNFVDKYNLGTPIAGNFLVAQNENI